MKKVFFPKRNEKRRLKTGEKPSLVEVSNFFWQDLKSNKTEIESPNEEEQKL